MPSRLARTHALKILCLLAPIVIASQCRAAGSAEAKPPGTIRITAALVDQEMQVRPVPLHSLLVASASGDTLAARTGLDGTATLSVPPGEYTIMSAVPALFQTHRYRWTTRVTVLAGGNREVALTNDNAATEEVDAPPSSQPSRERVDAAAALFDRLSRSVFRIESGLAHGTGFLADTLGGVVITNAHVIESSEANDISVVLDARTRVRGHLIAHDPSADIAVLRINPILIEGRSRIPLQRAEGKPAVVPGERLVAMGYPLHQDLTITAGIASSIRAGAVISDVNINHGNSGGPLLNIDGQAVAVNTFGDFSGSGGPGVSGSVLIGRAGPALARAAAEIGGAVIPSPELLPVMPSDRLEIARLKAYADSVDLKRYRKFSELEVGPFQLTVQTPVQTFVAIKAYEMEVAKDRKKREARAGLVETERYSEVREYRDWGEYVGAPTTPVVTLSVTPKVGETGGSVFKRLMLGPNLQATYRFKGDVRGAQMFRNGEPVEPIRGGHTPMKVFQEDRWVSLKDVADQAVYVFDVEALRPDSTGMPPSLVIVVRDLKNPGRLKCLELPAETVAQAWNDFEGFYGDHRPGLGFRRAEASVAKKRKSAQSAGFLKEDCSWPYQ
jgi:S1-C subfamily serine protease